MKNKTLQIIGWIGAILIIGAYFAVSFDFLSPDSIVYQALNIFGSLGIVIEASSKRDWQPTFLNTIWILIAIFAIIKIIF